MLKQITILLCLALTASAQNDPFYGNIVPADSTGYDLGRPSLHWDTLFYNALVPPIGGAGIWSEVNDSTIVWTHGGDTLKFTISNGVVSIQSGHNETFKTVFNDGSSHSITMQSPSISTSYTITLPTTDGSANQYLQTNGSGVTTWATVDTSLWEYSGGYMQPIADTTLRVFKSNAAGHSLLTVVDESAQIASYDSATDVTQYIYLDHDADETVWLRDSTGSASDCRIYFNPNGMFLTASRKITITSADSIVILRLPVDTTGLPTGTLYNASGTVKVK